MAIKKWQICATKGYHDWNENFNSIGETYEEMDMVAKCKICGAVAEGRMVWYDER